MQSQRKAKKGQGTGKLTVEEEAQLQKLVDEGYISYALLTFYKISKIMTYVIHNMQANFHGRL